MHGARRGAQWRRRSHGGGSRSRNAWTGRRWLWRMGCAGVAQRRQADALLPIEVCRPCHKLTPRQSPPSSPRRVTAWHVTRPAPATTGACLRTAPLRQRRADCEATAITATVWKDTRSQPPPRSFWPPLSPFPSGKMPCRAAKLTKPQEREKNPVYLQGDSVFFHVAAKPPQNCRETPRNPLRFRRVLAGFGRVSRHRLDTHGNPVKYGATALSGRVSSVSRHPGRIQACG